MPANRVKRSVEDERLFQKSKRMRNTLAQRERRQKLALQLEYNRFNIQVEDIQENYIGKMDILCKNCSARHFQVEEVNNKKTFNDCCSHGEVNLEPLPDSPDLIKNLFNGSHEFSKNFHERIRSYNNAFAFASFNANLVNFPSNNRPGPYCFKIHGQIYYQINTSLYPSGDDIPSFGQLFIVDQNEATNVRSQFNKDSCLNMEIIEAIGNTLCEINVFAKSYQMMHEELQQTINDGQEETEMRLIFSTKPGKDARRYNVQKINEVANDTLIDENGYPSYRRRNTGAFQRQTGNSTDNQYVVPHNPMLLLIFNCHINVEIVSSIKAIKYLYKYIYKGHDAASIVVTNSTAEDNTSSINYDEIVNHIETRYVSPVEACDRIYGRPLQEKSHSITRLPVHLSNQQTITLNDEAEETIRMIMNQQTMLMDYFALNQRDPMARIYTYAEIPEHYVFKKGSGKNGIWKPRKQQFNVIGRMYSISPSQVELFHLRLLLLKVKGATSFENIRTIDGVMHDTYRSACLALGLIEDDEEWDRAMTEGEVWMMPKQLRHLFVRILIHCCPVKPEILWENYKDSMSDDFKKKYSLSQSYTKLYHEIVKLLEKEKSNISKFATMPSLIEFESLENLNNEEIVLQNHSEIGLNQYKTLNIKQKIIVDEIMDKALSCRKDNLNSCFYIDGPGGSGKTYVYSTIYHLLRSNGKKVATMAFTEIAAILLPEGRTMHTLFAMPVPIYVDSTSNIKQQSKAAEELRNIDVIICDEAPMAPRYCLELADRTCRDIMNNKLPFGGKIMLMGGDFRQLLPVLKNENMRTLPEESEFAKYILDVGNGTLNDNNDNLVIPKECLANRNDDIVEKNFTAIDSTENCDNGELNNYILPEYLNTLNPPNFPPYELKMRLYCIVMLLRNISQSEGLCNGTRLQVLSMSNNLLKCRILTGDKENDIVFIHRITLYCEDVYPFTFKRRQFPIKIAFGMTINKCQGQTFEMIN
ncbi:uncharacterized protein LOC122850427 [Aphidius gifuensis]|uniref:uncharacterized protein LOC122850427 n=1 Tax=Aphidius gifuensis TaxID=684658 RepID=UPI001CDC0A4B|nr:uncharacterized protein LOC122850427 [Aphidius gifuensis]